MDEQNGLFAQQNALYRLDQLEIKLHDLESKNGKDHREMREAITEVNLSGARTDERYTTLISKIDNLDSKVEEMQSKPSKRWDTVVTGIIMSVVGIVIGLLMNGPV